MLEELIADTTVHRQFVVHFLLVAVIDSDDGVVDITKVGIILQVLEHNLNTLQGHERSGVTQTALTAGTGIFSRVGSCAEHVGIAVSNRSLNGQVFERIEFGLEGEVVAAEIGAVHDGLVIDAVVGQAEIGVLHTTAHADVVVGVEMVSAKGLLLPVDALFLVPVVEDTGKRTMRLGLGIVLRVVVLVEVGQHLLVRTIVGDVGILVGHTEIVLVVHHLVLLGNMTPAHVTGIVQMNLHLVAISLGILGGDDDYTVSALGTVDSRSRGVLEYVH